MTVCIPDVASLSVQFCILSGNASTAFLHSSAALFLALWLFLAITRKAPEVFNVLKEAEEDQFAC